jgi:TonB family protein
LSYAARVRAKVARHKPSGRGHRGIARVAFGVSGSGRLRYARLAKSSGNSALDRAAVSAVRRAAPFGAPPAGASAAQLRFTIPFYFR